MRRMIFVAGVVCTLTVFGQTPTPRPAFEAASIKANKAANGSDTEASPGYLRIQGSLKSLIRIAYGIRQDQVEGGPKWIDEDHFDIEARAADPATTPQLYVMLQTLLADRFKLEFHRETKAGSGYALVVAKGGLKMTPADPNASHSSHGGSGIMTAESISIAGLATSLSRTLGMPVSDDSGNPGFFNFKLTWAPDKSSPNPAATESADSAGPSIFTAVQEQLGLKLEPRKTSTEVVVVDRAAKPILD